MCRLVAWVSETPRTLRDVLGPVALERLRHLSTVHADGWGAAWHDDDGTLRYQHSPTRAGADDAFSAFADGLASRACLVHLRLGTPGYGHGRLSTHPFVDGDWAFGHNGAILPTSRIDEILDPESRRTLHGPTDSERYFVALRDAMDRYDGSVADAMGDVVARIDAAGLEASSLNALVLGPGAVHVISRHDPIWQVGDIPVWPAELAPSAPAYFPMSYRVDATSVTAVSSGIVDPSDAWQPIPNDSVLRLDEVSLAATIEPVGRPRRDRGVAQPGMFA
jgi:predicted glutamine amidotransferase